MILAAIAVILGHWVVRRCSTSAEGLIGMGQYELSPRVRLAIGVALGVGGLVMTVAGIRQLLLSANPLQSPEMAGVLMGLVVLFSGVSIALPPVASVQRYVFGALVITCMALLFDWVAFAPGPRDFHTGASAINRGGSVSSTFGRVAFGLGAIFFNLFAFHAWRETLRQFKRHADPDPT
jgi:hypothetical protein